MAQAMSIVGCSMTQMTLLTTEARLKPFQKDLPQFSIIFTLFLCTTVFAHDATDGKEIWISVNCYKANQVNKSQANKLWKQSKLKSLVDHAIVHVVTARVQTGDNATNSLNTEK
jgi:hypothetical protein